MGLSTTTTPTGSHGLPGARSPDGPHFGVLIPAKNDRSSPKVGKGKAEKGKGRLTHRVNTDMSWERGVDIDEEKKAGG